MKDRPAPAPHDLDAASFVESLGEAKKRKTHSSRKGLQLALYDLARVFVKGQAGDDFYPRHLVALYAKLHEQVYEVKPIELEEGHNFVAATSAATKILRDEFADDMGKALAYMRWTWQRERETEKYRRQNGTQGRRIGWRLMFCGRTLVTDYRVGLARASEHQGARP